MKITGYVHWVNRSWYHRPQFEIWPQDMADAGPEFVLAGTVEVDWTPPAEFDPRPQQIQALRDAKNKLLADAQVKANNIEEQIQKLQALEFKGVKA